MDRRTLKNHAREQVREAGRKALGISAVFVACLVGIQLLSLLPGFLETTGQQSYDYISAGLKSTSFLLSAGEFLSILLNVAEMLLLAGGSYMLLQLHDYADPYYSDLLAGAKLAGKVIILGLLAAVFTGLWTYAFGFIPSCILISVYSGGDADVIMEMMEDIPAVLEYGILAIMLVSMFVASYRYRFHTFILMDRQNMSASQALSLSKQITRRHRLQLFMLDFSLLPWYLLCLLPGAAAAVLYSLLGIANPALLAVDLLLVLISLALTIWKLPYLLTVYVGAYRALMELWNQSCGTPSEHADSPAELQEP